ncbi:hypothetical protein BDP27DRAFT_1338922 [Rhodocollybia butyracea]|uniref:Uncharacterized protein n=1 Tax=Rhodocollybia butyracea TaxID=206335 RepID=A0A9P5TYW3_9AGAR|nr:hypothetical protein BDP27DRAFT_1338922 [Rhodocollybia butyracea]
MRLLFFSPFAALSISCQRFNIESAATSLITQNDVQKPSWNKEKSSALQLQQTTEGCLPRRDHRGTASYIMPFLQNIFFQKNLISSCIAGIVVQVIILLLGVYTFCPLPPKMCYSLQVYFSYSRMALSRQ